MRSIPHHRVPSPPPLRGEWRADARARAAYAEGAGIFRILPAAVAVPRDLDDLARILRWASLERVPIVPRGAGTGMAGDNVGAGVVLDLMHLLPRRLVVADGVLIASAGVRCAEADAAAAAAGLRMPVSPSSAAFATLGGMVNTDAAGARTVHAGGVRRWLRRLTLMTIDGELTTLRRGGGTPSDTAATRRFAAQAAGAIRARAAEVRRRFPAVAKNAAGYALDRWLASRDLLDLVVGSEGTLGLVVETEWQLESRPAAEAALAVALTDLDALPAVIGALRDEGARAIELLDRSLVTELSAAPGSALARLPGGAEALLLVAFEGEAATVAEQVAHAEMSYRRMGHATAAATAPEQVAELWRARHRASSRLAAMPGRRSLQVVEDGCVPIGQLPSYIRGVRAATGRHGIPAAIFGHAGDGHLHVNLLPDVALPGWEEAVARIAEEVHQLAMALGGSISGEHGAGRLRAPWLERQYGAGIMALFARVKFAFDPHAILNPGIILPGGEPILSQLKLGAAAVPIADDIALAFRTMEREGRWDTDRLALADAR